MKPAPRWRQYLRLAKPNVAADVDDELTFHLEMRIADNIRRGMSPEDAEREARSRFGDVVPIREVLVEHDLTKQTQADRREFLGDLFQDIRFGLRSLKRAPGFAAAAIATLAIGIGANTAIFSVVDALLLRPLPYARPHELVGIGVGSAGEFLALKERLKSYSELAAYAGRQLALDDGTEATRLLGAAVTPNLFRTLGITPALGSVFPDDAVIPNRYGQQVILSDALWRQQFGANPSVIGKIVTMDGVSTTIVGVMPADFRYPSNTTQFWVPLSFNPRNTGAHWAVQNGIYIGRIKQGVPLEQGLKEVRDVWPTLRHLNPLWDPGPTYRIDANPTPLQEQMVGAPKTLLWTLIGCVMLVLLIACVNVANLLLARSTARERELGVRAAVGGGRGRLVRQLVTESVLLAGIGGVLGLALAVGAVRWLVSILPPGIPRVEEIGVNSTVLLVTGGIAIATGLLFGIIPALRATNGATSGNMIGRRSTQGARHHRLSGFLVGGEVALAVMLVIAAQLLVRSFNELRNVEPGFEQTKLIAARISPPSASYYEQWGKVNNLYNGILSRLSAVPGVQSVGAVDKMPIATSVWGIAPRFEGLYEDGNKTLPDVHHFQMITPGYFRTMRIPLLSGRNFETTDAANAPGVAIISESMARKFWPNQDAVGKRIGYPWPSPWITIVGIVADVKQDSLRDTLPTSIYVPWEQRTRMSSAEMWVIARTAGDPIALSATIRAIARETDRTVPVSNIRTMEEILDRSVQRDRFTMLIVGLFAGVALLLGAVGIYGVMSYLVSQRTQEMGVRIALGASAGSVLGLVVKRGLGMAGVGAVAGVIGAIWATKPLAAFLYGVSATDPLTFATVPLLFLLVATGASYFPARRATKVDPIRALRSD